MLFFQLNGERILMGAINVGVTGKASAFTRTFVAETTVGARGHFHGTRTVVVEGSTRTCVASGISRGNTEGTGFTIGAVSDGINGACFPFGRSGSGARRCAFARDHDTNAITNVHFAWVHQHGAGGLEGHCAETVSSLKISNHRPCFP